MRERYKRRAGRTKIIEPPSSEAGARRKEQGEEELFGGGGTRRVSNHQPQGNIDVILEFIPYGFGGGGGGRRLNNSNIHTYMYLGQFCFLVSITQTRFLGDYYKILSEYFGSSDRRNSPIFLKKQYHVKILRNK